MSPQHRLEAAQDYMAESAYTSSTLTTPGFLLFTARPDSFPQTAHTLTIVIEGDGLAWLRPWTPSDNPTPKTPTGLYIAAALTPPALYLARPCQYTDDPACNTLFWTDRRFAASVLAAYDSALDQLKAIHGNTDFHLIGYSGGGYIAAAMAAHRSDIVQVTGIAGLFDLAAWTGFHDITPLETPYDSATLLEKTKTVPFHHVCGRKDEVVPCALMARIIESAQERGLTNHRMTIVDGAHETMWPDALRHIKIE